MWIWENWKFCICFDRNIPRYILMTSLYCRCHTTPIRPASCSWSSTLFGWPHARPKIRCRYITWPRFLVPQCFTPESNGTKRKISLFVSPNSRLELSMSWLKLAFCISSWRGDPKAKVFRSSRDKSKKRIFFETISDLFWYRSEISVNLRFEFWQRKNVSYYSYYLSIFYFITLKSAIL